MGTAVPGLNGQTPGQDGDWNTNASGNWSTGPWTALTPGTDYPSGVGATALIIHGITATRTITLDVPVTLGTLILGDNNNTSAFVIGSAPGAGTIVFDNDGLGNLNNGGELGAYFNHSSGTSGLSPSGSDRIDANVTLDDLLTIDADRNIEFRGAWTGNSNDLTLLNSNASSRLNDPRFYWNASGSSLGVLSGVNTLNIINGEARFDGAAGVADSQLIGATTINLGDGTLQTDSDVFPRLYLVNTETTQTANLNVNGGWLVSDLGSLATLNGDGIDIWSGNINFTGAASTNLFDVNDSGTPEVHYVSGVIGGTGGFSKINQGSLNILSNSNIAGNVYIQRAGEGEAGLVSKGGITLSGAAGALSNANSIVLSRDGSLYIDNSTDILDEGTDGVGRIGNSTQIELRATGRLRIIGNSAAAVNEDLGALLQATGSGKLNFDFDDTTPQLVTLTFDSYTRSAGSITQFQVLDATGTFGSAAAGNAQLFITGAATQFGGGTANNTTTKSVVQGAYGGVNNIADQFMTFDSVLTTELRPLTLGDRSTSYAGGTEFFQSSTVSHSLTAANLGTLDQNVNIDFDSVVDGDVDWYAVRPVNITTHLAMNSLRFGVDTPTSGTVAQNTNEIGGALVLAAGTHVYLGDSLAVNTGLSGDTNGSGMILFGRAADGTSPGHSLYIAGGVLDFGSREAIIVNESGNSAFIRSQITGSGGLTKAGAQTVYLDNSNTYTGDTNIAEGILVVRDQNGLGDSTMVRLEGDGRLYLELGSNIINSATTATPPDLFIGINSVSTTVLYSNGQNNTWGGDVIIDTVDNAGNWVFTPYIGTNSLATLNINGDIYSNEVLNPISTDIVLNDARLISTGGQNSAGGVINFNGQFRDSSAGGINAVVTSDNENQLLRFQMRGSNELVVNVRQQWDAAGRIMIEQGILRYEGDGNFYTDAAAFTDTANGQSGLDMSGSAGSSTNNNNSTFNTAFILTKAGQVLNIGRIDIGGDGTNNFNGKGNVTLAGTNTSGSVTFGNGTERIVYQGASSANAYRRDLTAYQAGGGTMEFNFRLDDTDVDTLTSFTKIGRGVVNYNSAGTTDGDVEILYMSGGLLRLTNYDVATGRRFDDGAKLVLAGGGIEMDTTSAIAAETANYTSAAISTWTGPSEVLETLVNPGGTDVIVTAGAFNATMNIGSATVPLTRLTGGTVNFVENVTGAGASSITLQGNAGQIQANDTAYAWATYGSSYTYNAAAASYTLNALDFAATTGAGLIGAFAGPTREENSLVSTWATTGNDLSENGAGFDGSMIAAALPVNTIHFDFDGAGSIDATNGLEVTSGGIMVSSLVTTGVKSIVNGTLNAGVDADLIIHQYGGADMTISSVIQDNSGSGAGGNALVKTGSGNLILTGMNTYTGGTYLNGGQLTIASNTNLGATPGAAEADNIYANGGTLRVVSDVDLDANRGMTLGGNGVEISVGPAATLTFNGVIASEPNSVPGYAANPAVGRIDKTGFGTLVITNANNTFNGLTEVKEGTLKWAPAASASATRTPFGSNSAFLDGTIVRNGATLDLNPGTTTTNQTFTLQEWFTFEGGSTLDIARVSVSNGGDANITLNGVLQFNNVTGAPAVTDPTGITPLEAVPGFTVVSVARRTTSFNNAGGYMTGNGGIIKTGAGALALKENSPEWTGQIINNQGSLYLYGAGNVIGTGTAPIILGRNSDAEANGEAASSTNTTVNLIFIDEGGYRDVSNINQDIIIRNEGTLSNQTKQIGAQTLADVDVVNFNGSLILNDDVTFYNNDNARDITAQTAGSSTAQAQNARNDGRSIGALTNSETYFINFNGNIVGTVGNDINTNVTQSGTANVLNGSITSPFDDMVQRSIFGLNGDNSAWFGDLTLGNTTSDVDTQHIVSVGNVLGISASNNVTMLNNATIQTAGNNITIGNLTATGTTDSYIENASTTAGSITITQTIDATVDVVLRDGLNFFQLQNGEVDAALSLVKAGSGLLTLTSPGTYTGSTTVSGGVLAVQPGVFAATSAVNVLNNSTLAFDPDGTGSLMTLAANTHLTLGDGGTSGGLVFQLDTPGTSDSIALQGTGVLTANAGLGVISGLALGGFGTGSYDLVTGPNSIVNPSNLQIGALPGGFSYALDALTDPTKLTLIVTAGAVGDLYWTGDVSNSWASLIGGGSNSNWATDLAGTTEAGSTPGTANTVNFSATTSANYSTTLDNAYSVQGINILSGGSAVTIAQGNVLGSLTLGTGGIDVQTGAPATTTLSAPVIVGANQSWTVTDPGSALLVSGNISGTADLTKDGAGILTLSGNNIALTGTLQLAVGTLNFQSATALGAGTFSITGGTIDNTFGAALILTSNNPISWNGSFTFTGTDDLNLGTGDVTLAGSSTLTTSAGILTVAKITGTGGLTKDGTGTLEVGAGGDYSGATLVSDGVLQAAATDSFSGSSAYTVNGSGILRLNNFSQTGVTSGVGSLAGSGTVENGGASSRSLNIGADNTNSVFSGTLQNGGTGLLSLIKVGTGMLTLSGTNNDTMTGNMTVNGGILAITGSFSNGSGLLDTFVGNSAGTQGVLYVQAGGSYSTDSYRVGGNASGVGVIVVNGGTLSSTTPTVSDGISLGAAGYGGLFVQNGSVTTHRIEMSSTNANSTAVIRVDGGTLEVDEYIIPRNQHFELTVTGGLLDHTPAAANISLAYQNGGRGTMSVTGGVVDNTGRSITIRENNGTPNVSINLDGGQVITNSITKNNGAGTGVVNFNGGTLTPGSDGSTLFSNGNGLQTIVNGAFGSFAGGVVIDTAGLNTTISAALAPPTGSGVDAASLSFAPGSGYIGAPILEFDGDGTGATGYAVVDLDPASGTYGQITGVVLTNPGVDYTSRTHGHTRGRRRHGRFSHRRCHHGQQLRRIDQERSRHTHPLRCQHLHRRHHHQCGHHRPRRHLGERAGGFQRRDDQRRHF
jgi:autotransporter-associated beta strand protein